MPRNSISKASVKTMKVEAIDLFCGVGGLTYGLRQAGIKVLAGLDNDVSCKYAYEKNNKCKFINADIVNYDFKSLRKLYSKRSIRVLVGCAPCQPFSSHTFKAKNREKDNRWNLIKNFVKAIKELDPDVISMENVRGLTKTNVFEKFVKTIEKLGYEVDYEIVHCPDYGIPQNRSRLVLLGSKLGKIVIPEKTHTKQNYITIKEVIGNLPSIKSGGVCLEDPMHKASNLASINLRRIKQSKPNGTWRDWDKALLPNCYKKASGQTYSSVYGRMSWDKVSPTITTQFSRYGSGRFGHPKQNRALSIREGALLQTFPKKYDFGGNESMTKTCMHIGNAVPPELGKVIGRAIIKSLRCEQDNG